MAKAKIDMSKLSLGTAKPIKKKTTSVEKVIDNVDDLAVKRIHKKVEAPEKVVPEEPIVRITVDVFKSMHKAIKLEAMNRDTTIREYIIGLVKKDLKI
ncbi:MAG: hypothetical protein AAF960_02815 [Bacteroidota bacterium]